MIKIGEFSWVGRVSIKTLRHYDRVGLLKPIRVDPQSGYRYYSIDQLPRLNRILALKNLGLSLGQIAQIINSDLPPAEIQAILRYKRTAIEDQLHNLQLQLAQLKGLSRQIAAADRPPKHEVTLKTVEAQQVAALRDMVPPYEGTASVLKRLFDEVEDHLAAHRLGPTGPSIALWCDDEEKSTNIDIEVAIPIDGPMAGNRRIKNRTLPKRQVACMVHRGPLPSLHQAYMAGFQWIERSGYCLASSIREIYLQPERETCGDQVVELQFPVDKI